MVDLGKKIKVLILEDNEPDMEILKNELRSYFQNELEFAWADNRSAFIDLLHNFYPDIVLSDYNLPQFTGFDALEITLKFDSLIPFIIVTGTLPEEVAAESIIHGAWDYVVKERLHRLKHAIVRTLTLSEERKISMKHESELKIRRYEESIQLKLFWDAFNSSPVSIMITTPEAKILYVNPRFELNTGYSAAEIIGKNPSILKSTLNSQSTYSQLWRTIQKGEIWEGELINKRKNGDQYWEHLTIAPIKNNKGKIRFFVSMLYDISERKKKEEELFESKQKYQNLVEELNDVVFEINSDYQIVYISPAVEKRFGYLPSELIGKNILDLVYPDDVAKLMEVSNALLEGKESVPEEFRVLSSQGEYRWVRSSSNPIKNAKEIVGIRGLLIDISIRKEAELELIRAKDNAEASDNLKTEFMNNISHEIRTPLNGILGFAPFLIDKTTPEEDKQEYLNFINLSSQRLLQTINDYMDISLLTSKNMVVNTHEFRVGELVQNIIKQIDNHVIPKGVKLLGHVGKIEKSRKVGVDITLLDKAVNHLVANAIKFTKAGEVKVSVRTENEQFVICVADTGIGIHDESVQLLFTPFSHINPKNTRGHEGSGLGLSIVYGIVKLLSGNISVESKPDVGSTFTISLPILSNATEPMSNR